MEKNQPQRPMQPLKAPGLPKKFVGRTLSGAQLAAYGRYAQLGLTSEQFSGQFAEHLSFEETLLKQVSLHTTELAHVRLGDSRLSECDLANANWLQADCARVEILHCRLTGFRAIESRWQDALFKDCQASLAQFRFAIFKTARFDHCDLSDADFQSADLTGVAFVDCDLSRAELSGAKLAGADLRGCKLDGVHAGLNELRGAIIDPSQSLALVQAFGIVVTWPGQDAHEM